MAGRAIRCRCDRRHPIGTQWCPCGAYLPHDGTEVDDAELAPAIADPATPATRPAEAARVAIPPDGPPSPGGVEPGSRGVVPRRETIESVEPDRVDDEPARPDAIPRHSDRDDDVVCVRAGCGARNERGRVFCRTCGSVLGDDPSDPRPRPTGQTSWWRRCWAWLARRDPLDSIRSAQGSTRRASALSLRTHAFRTAAVGGVLGVLVVALVPGLRSAAIDLGKDATLVDRYAYVDVATAVPLGGEALAGWEPELIADGALNRAWGGLWTGDNVGFVEPNQSEQCLVGDYPGVRLTFEAPTDLDRARVWAGTWEGDDARAQGPRPATLQIAYIRDDAPPDGCEFASLTDQPEPQTVALDGRDVTAVELRVVGVVPGGDLDAIVAISELWLERAR